MEKQASLQDGQPVFGPVPQLPQILVVQRVERVISGEGMETLCDDGRRVRELMKCFFTTSKVHQRANGNSASSQESSPLCYRASFGKKKKKKKSNQEQLPHRLFLKESLLPVLTHNYRRRLRHGTVEKGYEDGLSPDFLLLSANKAQFAEKRKGHEGVGPSHCQIASDLLQLAQTGLQLSGNVVCKNNSSSAFNNPPNPLNARARQYKHR